MLSLNMSRVVDDTHCNRVMQISPLKYIIKNKLIRFDETKMSESCTVGVEYWYKSIPDAAFEREISESFGLKVRRLLCSIFRRLWSYVRFLITLQSIYTFTLSQNYVVLEEPCYSKSRLLGAFLPRRCNHLAPMTLTIYDEYSVHHKP